MTDAAERRKILAEARETLAQRPERYEPPEPLHCRTYDPGPSELPPDPPRRLDTAPQPATDWSAWEDWVSTRIADAIAAERKMMIKIVARALAETTGKDRDAWEHELRELHVECAKLSSTLDSLHEMIAAERSKVIDLPALPRRGDFN